MRGCPLDTSLGAAVKIDVKTQAEVDALGGYAAHWRAVLAELGLTFVPEEV